MLAEELLSETRQTITGRVRGRCHLSESTAEFLDLVDDVLKAILFEVAVVLGFPAYLLANTLVIEIPDSDEGPVFQHQIEMTGRKRSAETRSKMSASHRRQAGGELNCYVAFNTLLPNVQCAWGFSIRLSGRGAVVDR